jgi:hypothetical protein
VTVSLPDIINGTFELSGAFFIYMSIRKVLADKAVAGVHWVHVGFFAVWGLWNLYYYPHLGQWWSFVGGVAIVVTNLIYVGLLLRYSSRAR